MSEMSESEAYQKLMAHPVWGNECRMIAGLPGADSTCPAVVGGAVRDLLIGRELNDLDVATAYPETARVLAVEFAKASGRTLVEYKHEQGIYRVAARGQPQIDFTDPVGGTRELDNIRRDFTMNAMSIDLTGEKAGELVDPLGGENDIRNRVVRMTSRDVFPDDPLRVLRAFRFAAKLGFEIDTETLDCIRENSALLGSVAGERVQLELLGIFNGDNLHRFVILMDDAGILSALFPELDLQKGMEQNDYHHLDVWGHTVEAVRQIERVLDIEIDILKPYESSIREYVDFIYQSGHTRKSLIKLAALLHDITKPHCRAEREDGRVTFIGHERMGAKVVYDRLTELKFPAYERDFVSTIIAGHLRPVLLGANEIERPRTAYRFFRDFEDVSLAIILMSLADRLAAQGSKITAEHNDRHFKTMAYLLDCLYNRTNVIVRPPQLIDGKILMKELGLESGPMIGHMLGRVAEAQVMGEVVTKVDALEFCRKIVEGVGGKLENI